MLYTLRGWINFFTKNWEKKFLVVEKNWKKFYNPDLDTLVQVAVHNSCSNILFYVFIVDRFGESNFFYKTLFAKIADFAVND